MSDKSTRVLNTTNIKDIAEELAQFRRLFLNGVEEAHKETINFALKVADAIGEISVSEAKQGIKNFFCEQIDKI